MPYTVTAITEESESAVRALFEERGLSIRETGWARCFSPEAPEGFTGTPFAAMDDGEVCAFLVSRPQMLQHQGGLYRSQIIYDMVTPESDRGEPAGHSLLEFVSQRTQFTFAAGWGHAPANFLRRASWKHIANWTRLRILPVRRQKAGQAPEGWKEEPPPEDTTSLQSAMAAERHIFFERPPGVDRFLASWPDVGDSRVFLLETEDAPPGAYIRLRETPGNTPTGREWHLLDFRGSKAHYAILADGLQALASQSGQPVYTSFLNPELERILLEKGAEKLRPRWMFFCRLGDPSLRDILMSYTLDSPWSLFPADFDLDV